MTDRRKTPPLRRVDPTTPTTAADIRRAAVEALRRAHSGWRYRRVTATDPPMPAPPERLEHLAVVLEQARAEVERLGVPRSVIEASYKKIAARDALDRWAETGRL